MKHPRDVILDRHRHAEPRLTAVRSAVLSQLQSAHDTHDYPSEANLCDLRVQASTASCHEVTLPDSSRSRCRDRAARRAPGKRRDRGNRGGVGNICRGSGRGPQGGADRPGRENDDDEPRGGGEVHMLDSNGRGAVHGRAVRVKVIGR